MNQFGLGVVSMAGSCLAFLCLVRAETKTLADMECWLKAVINDDVASLDKVYAEISKKGVASKQRKK